LYFVLVLFNYIIRRLSNDYELEREWVRKRTNKSEWEKSLDGVTGQLAYFAHAHSILANTKSKELRYWIYCGYVM